MIRALALILGLALTGSVAHGIDPADLLPPERAFALTGHALDGDRVLLRWDIADGYYMYRERFAFDSPQTHATLGIASLPEGELKDDPFFGPMEIYRGAIEIELPVAGVSGSTLELAVTSQGCADLGVCYPPETRDLALVMPASARGSAIDPAAASLPGLLAAPAASATFGTGSGWFAQQPDLLPPDLAFIPSVDALAADTLQARWTVAEGYYLYRALVGAQITGEASSRLAVVGLELPPGEIQTDAFFGEQQVYYDFAVANVRLAGTWPASGEVLLRLDYQGCADVGVCYPPMSQTVPVRFIPEAAAAPVLDTGPGPMVQSEQDRLAGILGEQRFWSLPVFFGLGLLLAFTPCVFPMVPILSGVIMGSRGQMSGWHGFGLSLAFVLAMAITYTAAGVAAAALGQGVQAWFQHPLVISGFAALFGLLALAMFGVFQLQMPVRWQSRLAEFSQRQSGGKYAGVAGMGALSALIVGPCMAPPLIGILTLIATTGDHLLGGAALFAMSLGMGTPLLVLGASAGRWLPHAGPWMDRIRMAFGIGLMAVALWLLERILPAPVTMVLWAALLISTALCLGALQSPSTGWRVVARGFGVVLLVYGCLMLVGVAAGGRDTLQPLRGVGLLASDGAQRVQPASFEPVKSLSDVQAILAANRGTPVVLDFYADWCVSCKQMERDTFPDPAVQRAWAGAVRLKADVTANDAADRELLKAFGLFGPPAMLFFDPAGRERPEYRVVGYMDAVRFARHLQAALAGS